MSGKEAVLCWSVWKGVVNIMGFEQWLQKAEQAGYKVANASHKVVALSLASVGAFGLYALFRDYRAYFLMRRDPEYAANIKRREETIRKLVEKS